MTEPKTTAVDDARKPEQIRHQDRCRSKSGYECTCSPERQGWRAALARIAELEAQLRQEREASRVQMFWDDQAKWSQATFGSDQERGPMGALKHLEKEARECQDDPSDLEEKADCLLLIFDATRRSGRSLDDLLSAAEGKLAKNKGRSWGKPTSDEPVEHNRTGEAQVAQLQVTIRQLQAQKESNETGMAVGSTSQSVGPSVEGGSD